MKNLVTKSVATLLVGVTMVAAVSPAEAQRYRGGYGRHYGGGYGHGYRHDGSRTGLALGAGALGLAVGAAIASNRGGGYGGGYYGDRGYNGGGYYYDSPRRYYRPRCYTERVWDDYSYSWRRVRFCD